MSELCRQHYRLALNEPLEKTPKGPQPGYAKGGKVSKRTGHMKGGKTAYRKSGGRGC